MSSNSESDNIPHSSCISGDSIEEVLDDIAVTNPPSMRIDCNENLEGQVELVLERFHGFNIVRCGAQFHAIWQRHGDFTQKKPLRKQYARSFSGCSIDEVGGAILSGLGCDQTVK